MRFERSMMRMWGGALAALALASSVLVATPADAQKVSVSNITTGGGKSKSQVIDGRVGGSVKNQFWSVVVPPGAYNGVATITVTELEGDNPDVELTISDPALNSFQVPVQLQIKMSGQVKGKSIFWWDPAGQVWREVPNVSRDEYGETITAPLYHFSKYGVREGRAGW